MHMEIDIPSPSPALRPQHSYKRARSPDDSVSQSRPTKRFISNPQDDCRSSFSMSFSSGSASSNSSRCTSEDWVQQASGLTIATPLNIGGSVIATDTGNELIAIPSSVSSKPQLTPLNTSVDSSSGVYTNHNAPMDGIQQHDSTSVEHSASSDSLPRPFPHIPPTISVQPPTPDMAVGQLIFTRSSTPLSDSMSISNSPVTFTSSPLRRKFTMGPRADCEKCRLGVKGHSVHLD